MKMILLVGGGLVVYIAVLFTLTKTRGLGGPNAMVLFGILATLGVTACAFGIWFKKKIMDQAKPAPATSGAGGAPVVPAGGDEIDILLREADQRLTAAKLAGGANISGLPVVFLIGDQATAKTSTIVASGLEPELLAGQVYQDNRVTPTRTANMWFARETVFLELGGRLLVDQGRWMRILKKLTPGKLKSVVGGGGQAPRAAVLCFDLETFARPDAAEVVTSAARVLQARLGEMAQTYGISLPVYVLFTKTDRVPFFIDYLRNFSNDEAGQIFGATLPIQSRQNVGVYAEEETRRLNYYFNELFYSLCDKRILFLPREYEPEKLPGAYEFPREFRKLRGSVVQFLVDVCRPSQLRSSPFLRGFYFSGVRPVQEQAAAPIAQQRSDAQSFVAEASATSILNIKAQQAKMQAAMAAAAPAGGGRRVPQWVFLSHLFVDLILKDTNAMGASRSSVKTSAVQRVLLGLAAALCLFYITIATVSFFGNRSLENQALSAARNIKSTDAAGGKLASLESLQELETLRQSLELLTRYEQEGSPYRLRWGLYTGSDLYPLVRKTYYNRFAQLLFGQTQSDMQTWLQKVGPTPGPNDDYGYTYDTLKGYLITTSNHEKSTRQFLSPLLRTRWAAKTNPDADRTALAVKQFDFYAEDLKRENPYTSENDSGAVDRSRKYLALFSGNERVYNFMIAEANRQNKSVNFNKDLGGADVVINNKDVMGAFTKGGWAFMQDAMKNVDKYFGGERWVLGDYASAKFDKDKLTAELQDRYTSDFIKTWKQYFKNTTLVGYVSLRDAAAKLNRLSGPQTPLLALFWLASQNSSVDSPKVKEALQPVYYVVPPTSVDRYVTQSTNGYVTSLSTLQNTINQAASQDPTPQTAIDQSKSDAANAHSSTKQVALNFSIDKTDHLELTTQKLLDDPIISAERLLVSSAPKDLNAKGGALCKQFSFLTNKFPFNPRAREEVTLAELNNILKPKDGEVWKFYDLNLKNLLEKQGNAYVAKPAGGLALTPQFVRFFNDVARFSDALYTGGGPDPKLNYTLKWQTSDQLLSIALSLDGQSGTLSPTSLSKAFAFPGSGEAKVGLNLVGGGTLDISNRSGLWSVFRFFDDADSLTGSGSNYVLEGVVRTGKDATPSMVGGKPLTYRIGLDTGGAPPIFDKNYLASLKCAPIVAVAK